MALMEDMYKKKKYPMEGGLPDSFQQKLYDTVTNKPPVQQSNVTQFPQGAPVRKSTPDPNSGMLVNTNQPNIQPVVPKPQIPVQQPQQAPQVNPQMQVLTDRINSLIQAQSGTKDANKAFTDYMGNFDVGMTKDQYVQEAQQGVQDTANLKYDPVLTDMKTRLQNLLTQREANVAKVPEQFRGAREETEQARYDTGEQLKSMLQRRGLLGSGVELGNVARTGRIYDEQAKDISLAEQQAIQDIQNQANLQQSTLESQLTQTGADKASYIAEQQAQANKDYQNYVEQQKAMARENFWKGLDYESSQDQLQQGLLNTLVGYSQGEKGLDLEGKKLDQGERGLDLQEQGMLSDIEARNRGLGLEERQIGIGETQGERGLDIQQQQADTQGESVTRGLDLEEKKFEANTFGQIDGIETLNKIIADKNYSLDDRKLALDEAQTKTNQVLARAEILGKVTTQEDADFLGVNVGANTQAAKEAANQLNLQYADLKERIRSNVAQETLSQDQLTQNKKEFEYNRADRTKEFEAKMAANLRDFNENTRQYDKNFLKSTNEFFEEMQYKNNITKEDKRQFDKNFIKSTNEFFQTNELKKDMLQQELDIFKQTDLTTNKKIINDFNKSIDDRMFELSKFNYYKDKDDKDRSFAKSQSLKEQINSYTQQASENPDIRNNLDKLILSSIETSGLTNIEQNEFVEAYTSSINPDIDYSANSQLNSSKLNLFDLIFIPSGINKIGQNIQKSNAQQQAIKDRLKNKKNK